MSSYYGVIFPEFWTGPTGRELRKYGKDAQLLGLYLATNRHANMLGLYRLLIDDVRHETGLGLKGIAKAFDATAKTEFALFDAASRYVWVRSMARFRLGLAPGEALAPEDKRATATNRLYQAIDVNPFLGDFYEANHRILRLLKRREGVGLVVPVGADHQMSGLPSPFDAPCKPVTDIRDQRSVTETGSSAPENGAQPVRPAFDHYHRRFLAKYHGKPEYAGAKDGARMSRLLKSHGLDEVTRRLDAFFDSADSWIQQSGHTLDVFFAAGTQTKLVAELGRRTVVATSTAQRYRDWTPQSCPHTPPCGHPGTCLRQQDLDTVKAAQRRTKAAS